MRRKAAILRSCNFLLYSTVENKTSFRLKLTLARTWGMWMPPPRVGFVPCADYVRTYLWYEAMFEPTNSFMKLLFIDVSVTSNLRQKSELHINYHINIRIKMHTFQTYFESTFESTLNQICLKCVHFDTYVYIVIYT